jgi:ankyrin repeat protein
VTRIANIIAALALLGCGAMAATVVAVVRPDWIAGLRGAVVTPTPPAAQSDSKGYADAVVIRDINEGGHKHFLGPHVSIRKAHPLGYLIDGSVVVELIVGETGSVLSAKAVDGVKAYYREAEELARRVKYLPFRRNGKPVVARIEKFHVQVFPPETRPDYQVPFPESDDLSSLAIKMTKVGGQGSFRTVLELRGDGRVTYESNSAAIPGKHTVAIERAQIAALVEVLKHHQVFWLKSSYASAATHQPIVMLEISFAGRSIKIWDYEGREGGMPDAVKDIQDAIDRAARVDRWRLGNEETAPTLLSEKWDFKANTSENKRLLAGIAARGSIVALRDLIALGAPIVTGSEGANPLIRAAGRGDNEIFDELMAQPVTWSEAALATALVAAAEAGNEDFVLALLWQKANPSYRDRAAGPQRTPLIAAADVSSVSVTELLIRWVTRLQEVSHNPLAEPRDISKAELAAFVSEKDEEGKTALHWAIDGRGDDSLDYGDPKRYANRGAVIAALLAAGADVNARNNRGETPLLVTATAAVARQLLAAGANVNARDKAGRTALMPCFSTEFAQVLLEAGIDVHAKDNEGRTAIDHAQDVDQPDVVAFLKAWVAEHSPKTNGNK